MKMCYVSMDDISQVLFLIGASFRKKNVTETFILLYIYVGL